ncbi:cupin domain-containing protein [Mycobacterium vicinigordonae]|uniref:Cupin-like domain-containing protein n=1 Tax=Mycobacterium vicinigordonae TaxID=1719132 RepID=A0A7D6HTJ2_9MYCO|nr:cupin domain-containing protein [Mycobacterium vicinigordonae]QLL06313.1 cupin-like domain-containing protein [Mycobacterium vicinigordonae]
MLSRCVATNPAAFAADHWGRLPLLSRTDELPRDFTDLLSPAAVDELIAERGVRAPFIRMVKHGDLLARDCYLGSGGFGAEMPDQLDPAKVLAQFASGATIVLQGLHRLWPPIIEFVRGMVDELGHPVQANAYITPPDSRGFDAHYDVHDVFVLQVGGHKRWSVHAPVHEDPVPSQPWTNHRVAIAERVTGEPVIDTVLSPGDALYLPRGWVHSAHSTQSTSIHLTIGVGAVTQLDVVQAVVDVLAEYPAFRKSLAVGADLTDRDEMTATATKVMAEVVDALRHEATAIGEQAAERLTRRHAQRTRPAPVRPLASLRAAESASRTPVQWRRGLIGAIESGGGQVVLRLPDRTMTFPDSCALALRALHDGLIVDAAATPGLDQADAAVLIRRLLREAVVVPAAAWE